MKFDYKNIDVCNKCFKEDAINIYTGLCCSCDKNESRKRPINKDYDNGNIKPLSLKGNLSTRNKNKDYCDNCDKYINQINLNGSFGCPICKRDDCITTFYNSDDEKKKEKLKQIIKEFNKNIAEVLK
jgi:hypothetical protein